MDSGTRGSGASAAMALNFYNRYIPPSGSPQGDASGEGAAPKRRRLSQDLKPQGNSRVSKEPKRFKDSNKHEVDLVAAALKANINPFKSSRHSEGSALDSKRHENLRRKLERATDANLRTQTEAESNGVHPMRQSMIVQGEVAQDLKPKQHGLEPLPAPASAPETEASTLDTLPSWLRNPLRIPSTISSPLSDFLPDDMCQSLAKHGYTKATAVQAGLLPRLLPGQDQHQGDTCIASSTGTGKTLAFIAPMIEALRNRPTTRLRGLVIVPTREIVSQTLALTEICASKTGLRVGATKGSKEIAEERRLLIRKTVRYALAEWKEKSGAPYDPIAYETSDDDASDSEFQFMRAFEGFVPEYRSKVDILICTPGRLVEHIRSTKGFSLDDVEWLIVDEMDRLLDQSFVDWTEIVIPALERDPDALSVEEATQVGLAYIMHQRRVRKILASATITYDPDNIAAMRLWRPMLATLEVNKGIQTGSSKFSIPTTLRERAIVGRDTDKPLILLQLLEGIFQRQQPFGDSSHQSAPSLQSNNYQIISNKPPALRKKYQSSSSDSSSSDMYSSSTSSSDSDSTSDSTGSSSSSDSDSSDDSSSSSGSSIVSDATGVSSAEVDTSPTSTRNKSQGPGVLIFTARNENAMRLTRLLSLLAPGLRIGAFTGASRQSERRKTLAGFRRGDLRVVVASNLASRSLNLEGLDHVINYDVPTSVEMYVHRVGRTARAGKIGTATTILARHEARWFLSEIGRCRDIQRSQKIERENAPIVEGEARASYETALAQLGDEARAQ